MLKQIVTYLLIIAGCGVMYISTSLTRMEEISSVRNDSDAWWGAHNSGDKGDLVNMAYLDYIRKFHSERDYDFHRPGIAAENNINLYMQGDSYTFKIPDSAFLGVNRYEYAWVGKQGLAYDLDTNKKNILLIARTERYIRSYFDNLGMLQHIFNKTKGTEYYKYAHDVTEYTSSVDNIARRFIPGPVDKWLNKMFNKNINQNLEYNLFNYNILNAPRLAKAWLNYEVFSRASGNVTIADDGDRLFLTETIDRNKIFSSYSTITDEEYNNLKNNMNILYDYYMGEGFDEMYMVIIPNPVTVLAPGGYNGLIPRLQNDTELNMKFIDVYSAFNKSDENIYRPGDTHWNDNGIQLWLHIVNDTLQKWNKPDADNSLVSASAQ